MIDKIAKIKKTHLGFEDHGIFTVYLQMDYGGTGQSVGGFALSSGFPAIGAPTGIDFIMGVLRACGVERWEEVVGRTIFVIVDSDDPWHAKPIGLKPLPTEKGEVFLFADWQEKTKQAVAEHQAKLLTLGKVLSDAATLVDS